MNDGTVDTVSDKDTLGDSIQEKTDDTPKLPDMPPDMPEETNPEEHFFEKEFWTIIAIFVCVFAALYYNYKKKQEGVAIIENKSSKP